MNKLSSLNTYYLLKVGRDISRALKELTFREVNTENYQGSLRSSPKGKPTKNMNKLSSFSTYSLLKVARDISWALKLTLGEFYTEKYQGPLWSSPCPKEKPKKVLANFPF